MSKEITVKLNDLKNVIKLVELAVPDDDLFVNPGFFPETCKNSYYRLVKLVDASKGKKLADSTKAMKNLFDGMAKLANAAPTEETKK